MHEQPQDDIGMKLNLQFRQTKPETNKECSQSRSPSTEPMSLQVYDNTGPALSWHAQPKQPETDESYTKQRIADLQANYDKVNDAMFKMSVDLMSAEQVANERAKQIVELELESNRNSGFTRGNPNVYRVLQDLADVKKERDALRREIDSQRSAAGGGLSECATMAETLDDSPHQKEVAELKRLLSFYKQHNGRISRQVEELKLELKSQQSVNDN